MSAALWPQRAAHPISPAIMRPFLAILIACTALLGPVWSEQKTPVPMEMIVHRAGTGIELFWSLPGETVAEVLAADEDWLMPRGATFDPAPFRQFGAFDLADEIFAPVQATLNGADAGFEAMSLMVHPKAFTAPFDTPFTAAMAIEVCTAPDAETPLTLDKVHVYAGFYAHRVAVDGDLHIAFPQTGRSPLEVLIREFQDGQLLRTHAQELADGGQITLAGPQIGIAKLWARIWGG